jgi:hypothetical protein
MGTIVGVLDTWASTVILLQYHIERLTIEAHRRKAEKEKKRQILILDERQEKEKERERGEGKEDATPLKVSFSEITEFSRIQGFSDF